MTTLYEHTTFVARGTFFFARIKVSLTIQVLHFVWGKINSAQQTMQKTSFGKLLGLLRNFSVKDCTKIIETVLIFAKK